MLSPVVNRIEVAHQQTTQQTQPSPLDQLRELGELRASGTISEDEFQSLKATIIGHIK
jgi:Short C-terminal domain